MFIVVNSDDLTFPGLSVVLDVVKGSFEQERTRLDSRVRRCYSTLKAKGLILDTCGDTPDNLSTVQYMELCWFRLLLRTKFNIEYESLRPTKEQWYSAIETAFQLTVQHQYYDDKGGLWKDVVEKVWLTIYAIVCLDSARAASTPSSEVEETLLKENKQQRQRITELEAEISEYVEKQRSSEVSLEQLRGDMEQLRKDLQRANKKTSYAESVEVQRLVREVSRRDAEIEKLQARLAELVTPMEKSPESGVEEELILLPKERVLCFGSYSNLHKKLREMYPDWDYISSDDVRKGVSFSQYDCVFAFTEHMSHKSWWRLDDNKDTPIFYVTATNVDRLLRDMQEQYSDYIKRRSAVGS